MLLSPNAIGAVTEMLDASDFYRESHGTIYRAALDLCGKGEPVDAITLANQLEERSELERVGGTARIAELAALVPATANAEHYARIVKEMATLRGLVRAGQEIARLGQTGRARPPTSSTGPSRSCSTSPNSGSRVTSRTSRPAQGELRADHAALRVGGRHHRHPDRVP